MTVFVKAKVNPILIFLTAGELGTSPDSALLPAEMAEIRKKEAQAAANSLHASLIILSFPDLQLPFIPLEKLVEQVISVVREANADVIFSFHPFETAKAVDHPDHNVAGQVARFVGAAADVKHFMPESNALQKRPELYLLTDDVAKADLVVSPSEALNNERIAHMSKHYPSQFKPDKKEEWVTFFSGLSEAYQRIR